MKIGVILLAALLLLAGISAYCIYQSVFCIPRGKRTDCRDIAGNRLYLPYVEQMHRVMDEMEAVPWEEVQITAKDGCRLYGKLHSGFQDAPLVLFFHGYHGSPMWDGYGCFKFCQMHHYNLLLADARAHGKSRGAAITFGIRERFDCQSWANEMADRFGKNTKLILSGVSMGAASVLMAQELKLPETVEAVVADCGYTAPKEIIKSVLKGPAILKELLYQLTRLSALVLGRFDLEETSALEALKHAEIPTLFIHGSGDTVIPCDMCRKMYDACTAEKEMVIIEGADHAVSAMKDFSSYESAVYAFLKRIQEKRQKAG